MESGCEQPALADRDRMSLPLRQDFDVGRVILDPGGADEDRADRLGPDARDRKLRLEALELTSEGVTAGVARRAGRGGRDRRRSSPRRCRRSAPPAPWKLEIGPASPSRSIALVIVVLSPPGMTRPSSPSSSAGIRTSSVSALSRRSFSRWAAKPPCEARTPIARGGLTSRAWRAARLRRRAERCRRRASARRGRSTPRAPARDP